MNYILYLNRIPLQYFSIKRPQANLIWIKASDSAFFVEVIYKSSSVYNSLFTGDQLFSRNLVDVK